MTDPYRPVPEAPERTPMSVCAWCKHCRRSGWAKYRESERLRDAPWVDDYGWAQSSSPFCSLTLQRVQVAPEMASPSHGRIKAVYHIRGKLCHQKTRTALVQTTSPQVARG